MSDLCEAICAKNFGKVKRLLSSISSVELNNIVDYHKRHPLILAVLQDFPEMVELLVTSGCNATGARDFLGRTPMHIVCYRSRWKKVPVDYYVRSVVSLIQAGCSPLDQNYCGKIPMDELFIDNQSPNPDFKKFMERITQLAKQRDEGDVRTFMVTE